MCISPDVPLHEELPDSVDQFCSACGICQTELQALKVGWFALAARLVVMKQYITIYYVLYIVYVRVTFCFSQN